MYCVDASLIIVFDVRKTTLFTCVNYLLLLPGFHIFSSVVRHQIPLAFVAFFAELRIFKSYTLSNNFSFDPLDSSKMNLRSKVTTETCNNYNATSNFYSFLLLSQEVVFKSENSNLMSLHALNLLSNLPELIPHCC